MELRSRTGGDPLRINTPLSASPLKVGSHVLPNRFVMGSMHTGLEGHQDRFAQLGRFYAERARGGAALIVTGGFSPNMAGRIKDEHCTITNVADIDAHREITGQVHDPGGRILLQLLHAGRYAYNPQPVAPSPLKSPINRTAPAELSHEAILQTIQDYADTAGRALEAGYDGIEIMGSEGYLMSQFLSEYTNHRTDEWGGSWESRLRFPAAVTKAVREALGPHPILSFRMSALDLVDGGMTEDHVLDLAKALEVAGADMLGTGIGWHESAVPTIAGVVPHAAFAEATKAIKDVVSIPVVASNRINLPEVAEAVLENGQGDLISMARPFLADADLVGKTISGRGAEINVCIACNQACLDHYFTGKPITCLLNPKAAREAEFNEGPADRVKKVAVVGAGVAGVAAALEARRRGHSVTLFEASEAIGGQLNLAGKVPGKSDYLLAIKGFEAQLDAGGVTVRLGHKVTASQIADGTFDEVVLSTGIAPRQLDLPGSKGPTVAGYTDILTGRVNAGRRVVVIGGGGIGHDVALYLAHPEKRGLSEVEEFKTHWGVHAPRSPEPPARDVVMLKRSDGRFGKTLGKSTGWILRQELKDFGVRQIAGVDYECIEEDGIRISTGGTSTKIPADTIVVCAGQVSENGLAEELTELGIRFHIIGGALNAGELDAQRAIEEGVRIGNAL